VLAETDELMGAEQWIVKACKDIQVALKEIVKLFYLLCFVLFCVLYCVCFFVRCF
jgi:hypothetical protein